MDVAKAREARKKQEGNLDRHDFAEEKEHLPLLHSGFVECCTHDPSKSAFFVQIWFQNGEYRGCLLDREAEEKAFCNFGELMDTFSKLQDGLDKLTLDWVPDKRKVYNRNGS